MVSSTIILKSYDELKHHGRHQRSQTKLYRVKKGMEFKSLYDVNLYLHVARFFLKHMVPAYWKCLFVCYFLYVQMYRLWFF